MEATQAKKKNIGASHESSMSSRAKGKPTRGGPPVRETGIEKARSEERHYVNELSAFYKKFIDVPPTPKKNATKILLNPNDFYRKILQQEKRAGEQLDKNLNVFFAANDAREQQIARTRVITSFWTFCEQVLSEQQESDLETRLRYLFRYGLLVSSLAPEKVLDIIANIDINADTKVTVYYVDEWLRCVAKGEISQSIINEAEFDEVAQEELFRKRLQRIEQQRGDHIRVAQKVNEEIAELHEKIRGKCEEIQTVRTDTPYGFPAPYKTQDLGKLRSIHELVHSVAQKNTRLETAYNNVISSDKNAEKIRKELAQIDAAKDKEKNDPERTMITRTAISELRAIRQMHKMCIGRRGNHFPIIHNDYFQAPIHQMGIRERVMQVIQQIENIDFTLFQRVIKGHVTRFFPLIVLVPCYGNKGICWEPFERYHRNTSTAKLAIPIYPRDLFLVTVTALGDYRWQVAKELAGQLWMEEGLTGWYFQWFSTQIKKGDIRERFIDDYILWIRRENVGIQKLDKNVREIFWRFIPFHRRIKEKLVTMSPVYGELYKKEKNRYMSELL